MTDHRLPQEPEDAKQDVQAAVGFVSRLYAGVEDGWLTIFAQHAQTTITTTRWVSIADLSAVAAHVDELAPTHDVWFGVATRRQRLSDGRRGGIKDCVQIPALWLDIDTKHKVHSNGNLPADIQAAGVLVRSLGPEPSIVVFSGHGVQPYWLLQEPVDAEEAAVLLARWQTTWERLAGSLHIDNVSNLDRIMRLPGTINRKDKPEPVTVRGDWSRRYGIDDLDELLDELPRPKMRNDKGDPWPERDHFNEHNTCDDVLLRYGCTLRKRLSNGQAIYVRPNHPNAHAAKSFVVYPDHHTGIYTDAIPGVEGHTGHDAWGLHVVLNCGGEWGAANETLRAELGPQWRQQAERIRIEAKERAVDDLVNSVNAAPQVIEWDTPIPLRVQPHLPTFPDESLPSWLGAFVRGVAQSTQTPIDLCAYSALAAIAVAAGGRVVVEVRGGWVEPTNLFDVSALPPGARKSAVVTMFSRPFLDYQRDQRDVVRMQLIEKQALKDANEASLKRLIRERDKPETKDDPTVSDATKEKRNGAIEAAARLVEQAQDEMPIYPRLLADDATPEALGSLMAEQKGRMGVLSAEGDIFDIMAGRYSGETNIGIYLRGHSGDPYLCDRKGRPPEYIERPALTLGLAVQPSVLREIGHLKNFHGRGLLARFLYSLPEDLVGRRDSNAPPIDAGVALTYEQKMAALIATLAGWDDDPMRLTLTDESRKAALAFLARIEVRLAPNGDLGSSEVLKEWASKLVGQSVRIAGGLHVAQYVESAHHHSIELTTMQAAIDIAENYCIGHARAAFDLMGQDPATLNAEAILAWIVREGIEDFSKRDVHVVHRARFSTAGEIDAPLALLERHGWIAPVIEPTRVGAGRKPSPKFQVNPAAQNTRITQNAD